MQTHFSPNLCSGFSQNAFFPSFSSSCQLTKDLKWKRAVRIYQEKGERSKIIGFDKKIEVEIFF